MSQPHAEFELDLDDRRDAVRREVSAAPSLKLNGNRHELPIELPLDVLEPLTRINVDVSVLIRQVLDARQDSDNGAILEAIVDMLVVNPQLPTEVVDAAKDMARRLFGEAGYTDLVAFRPTTKDVGALVKWVLARYGVSLGEASGSSDSAESTGTTSKPTSPAGTPATSATSGGRRRTRAS